MATSKPTPTSAVNDVHAQARGQLCPNCGEPAAAAVERRDGGIVTLNLTCTDRHIWLTKWLAAA